MKRFKRIPTEIRKKLTIKILVDNLEIWASDFDFRSDFVRIIDCVVPSTNEWAFHNWMIFVNKPITIIPIKGE